MADGVPLRTDGHRAERRAVRHTVLTCQAPHPVARPRLQGMRHQARILVASGEWVPTGRILYGEAGRAAVPAEGRAWAWCRRCKAATEYERRDQAVRTGA